MTEGSRLECRVSLKNLPLLNDKQPVTQVNRVMNTGNCKNLKSVSTVRKDVGLSDSEINKVTVRGNGDALCLIGEHSITRSENSKSTLELKRAFPSNYLTKPTVRNQLKHKINKRLTNTNYDPVCSNLNRLPREVSLSKSLDKAIEWYTKRNSSDIKQEDSHQLQENLEPVEDISFGHSMCTLIGRASETDVQCFCCAQGLCNLCVYKAKIAGILEEKNYKQLKTKFIKTYSKLFSEVRTLN